MGLLWLSTIPPTSALVAIMFGNRWLTMLLGLAFFSHQVGGFLGVWLGGVLFEKHRLLRRDLVGHDLVRLRVGGHQSADRRAPGGAPRRGCRPEGLRETASRATNRQPATEADVAKFKAIVVEKADEGQTVESDRVR